jgi:hypothetical protein
MYDEDYFDSDSFRRRHRQHQQALDTQKQQLGSDDCHIYGNIGWVNAWDIEQDEQ